MGAGLWPVLGQGRWANTRYLLTLHCRGTFSFFPPAGSLHLSQVFSHHPFYFCGEESTTTQQHPRSHRKWLCTVFWEELRLGQLRAWAGRQAHQTISWRGRRERSGGSRRACAWGGGGSCEEPWEQTISRVHWGWLPSAPLMGWGRSKKTCGVENILV